MNPKTELSPSAAEISGGEVDATTTGGHKTMSESSTINGVRGQGWCGRVGISVHQGWGGWGRRVNWPVYTSSIQKFKVELDYFRAVLGTTAKRRESKDQYKKFSNKLKQYVLQEFQNHDYINVLVLVWYKITDDHAGHINTYTITPNHMHRKWIHRGHWMIYTET